MRKVYGVPPALSAHKLTRFADGPIFVSAVDVELATSAIGSANSLGIDLADAVLLEACQKHGAAAICTDDEKLAKACA